MHKNQHKVPDLFHATETAEYFDSGRNIWTIFQKRPFVHNSVCPNFFRRVCSQFRRVFAVLFKGLLIEIQEEIGGLSGTKIVNKTFVNKLAFPTN